MSWIDNGAWEMTLTGFHGGTANWRDHIEHRGPGDTVLHEHAPTDTWLSDPQPIHANKPCEFRIPPNTTVTGYQLHLGDLTWDRGSLQNYEHFPAAGGTYTLTIPRDAFRLALAHWVDTGQWDTRRDPLKDERITPETLGL
jgi:hypothetical protein